MTKSGGKPKRHGKGSGGDGPADVRVSLFSQLAQADLVPTFSDMEVPCKAQGCTNKWRWNAKDQGKAWRELAGADTQTRPDPPHRMCKRCHQFTRSGKDLEIPCPRSDCDAVRPYRVDQQLHELIGGRKAPPPPPTCSRCATSHEAGDLLRLGELDLVMPQDADLMACVVDSCAGRWIFAPGVEVTPAAIGTQPTDRMCDGCRAARGAEPRMKRFAAT